MIGEAQRPGGSGGKEMSCVKAFPRLLSILATIFLGIRP